MNAAASVSARCPTSICLLLPSLLRSRQPGPRLPRCRRMCRYLAWPFAMLQERKMRANRTEYLFSVNTHTPPTMTVESGKEFTVQVRGAFDDVEDIRAGPTPFTPACDGHPLAPRLRPKGRGPG